LLSKISSYLVKYSFYNSFFSFGAASLKEAALNEKKAIIE